MAQIHLDRLVLNSKETFDFGKSDILVVDTLIMKDNSGILLNKSKKENYLHVKYAMIGENCFIDGNGQAGSGGQDGLKGESSTAPCRSGTPGKNGTAGTNGTNGTDLLFYIQKAIIKGKLTVSLLGGVGGNGGQGGEGGSGGSGTVHCNGGNGGNGGAGANGGDGGNGGTLTVFCPNEYHEIMKTAIKIINRGGQYGKGGRGGYSGFAGLGPKNKYGQNGLEGPQGEDGHLGQNGSFSVTQNQ